MRHATRPAFALVLVMLFGSTAFAATIGPTGKTVPGEVVMKLRASASAADITALERIADADKSKRIARLSSGSLWRMHSRSKSAEALAAALQKNPNVEYAEPNFVVRLVATPNDTSYGQLWGLKNTGQPIRGSAGTAGSDIDAEAAWNVTTGSSAVVVGVVDTGIDYTHNDLAGNMWTNPGGKGNIACGAGTFGYNAIEDSCDPMDDHDHGTHVAGTIGAVGNNSRGVVGVNWDVSLMGLKFLSWDGYGTTADAVAAIDFAVQAKIDGVNVRVLSNSWGGGPFSKALLDVINRANEHDILFVAAAGNAGANTDVYAHYPSNYATANMLSVAATDNSDLPAYFTNYGPTTVHLAAPGVSVLSTIIGNSYAYFSGTSMATPHVSGVAALLLAHTPSLTTAQVKSAILDNVDPITSMRGMTITGGRLNAARALGVPGEPDFSISIAPASRTVVRGGSASYVVTVIPANGFSGTVTLSATNLPGGTTATFTPPSTTASSTLVLATSASTPLTTTTFTVTGTSGAQTRNAIASLTTVATAPVGVCPSFSTTSLSAPSALAAVAIADFNRDGRNDYAAVERDLNRVLVRLANNSGGFLSSLNVGTGRVPLAVIAGDLNGDGKADLATANSATNNVSVALGNGDGTFQAAASYAAGASPFALVAGDFNADGRMDLAVGNNGASNVSILLGQNGGTFAAATHYGAGSGPYGITTGDFDRDGKLDLAVANFNADNVSILRGNGDGTFLTPLLAPVGDAPSGVVAGDFNRDGKLDLAVTNYQSDNVSTLTGNGDGTFGPAVHVSVGEGPGAIAAGDVTADGITDLMTANTEGASVSLLRGTSSGSFLPATTFPYFYVEPIHLVIGELTGDARPDVLVANSYGSSAYLLRNTGDCAAGCGTMAPAAHYIAGATPGSVATGDFNRDGAPDIATVNHVGHSVSISLGNGSGIFASGVILSAPGSPRGIAAGDFDRDGRLDLAVGSTSTNKVLIFQGNSDGSFQTAVEYAAGSTPRDVAIGDFDRDGALDLAVAANGADSVSILFGNGNATFDAPVSHGAGDNPESIATGDFNRDGRADLAVANSGSGDVSILLGNADGTFQTPVSYVTGATAYAVVAADLDRDGTLDLAVSNVGSDDVSVLLGNGDGTFDASVEYLVGDSPYTLTAGDYNNDGRMDLATANGGSHNVSILFGIEAGVFPSAVNSAVSTAPLAIATADFNRDGKADLVVTNSGAGNISVLLNTCPAPDLTVAKTHSGSFTQGQSGATYTITVTNSGGAATSSTVTVTDTLPAGLSATAISGTGWTCTLSPVACTRSDVLAGGASYPPITLTVQVAGSTAANVVNQVSVAGGGEMNTVNNTASDPTTILPATDVVVSKSHAGSFSQGAVGRRYTIRVRNAGGLATSGTITVTDTLPAGLTATAISGTGWSCTLGSLTCTRSDSLAGASQYPPIVLTVDVAANAPSLVTNTATVSGGGDSNTFNNTANDPTVIWSTQACGGFGAPTYHTTTYSASGMAVADLNGDGKQDVASVASYYDRVYVQLGTGTGTLQTGVWYTVLGYPRDVAAADMDHDGDIDLVVNDDDGRVSVLANNGSGTFAAAVVHQTGASYSHIVALGDLNDDGNADVAINGNGGIHVLLGNGNGTLGASTLVSMSYTVYSIAIADVDRDGRADLLGATGGGVEVRLGNGDGSFDPGVRYGNSDLGNLTVADLNNDGNPDVAATTYYNYNLTIMLGNGDGTLRPPFSVPTQYGSEAITAADVDADGSMDLLVANASWDGIFKFAGRGDGTFAPFVAYSSYSTDHLEVSDFNADGKADVAFTTWYNGSVGIMLGGCVDLSITKTHTGNFRGGQTGATYTITVRNDGPGLAGGEVTVTDVLPEGLTATSMFGSGWNCTLSTLTCKGTFVGGAVGQSYPPITVTVSVSLAAPTSVVNTATLSGGGDTNPANNTANDQTTIVHAADLTITKSHTGTFTVGQNGVYTITVGNIGTGASSGTVSVVDNLPAGMTPVSMSGSGWACDVIARSCSRSDSLPATQAYPPITLTITVSSANSSSVTNTATVAGGGDSVTTNNTAADPTTILLAPFITATAISGTQVHVTWNAVTGAKTYEVLRSSHNAAYTSIGTTISNLFLDNDRSPNTTYVYRVRAIDVSVIGPLSAPELASTFTFTDDPVTSTTPTKAIHIIELRNAVNAVRAAAGQAPLTFSGGVTPGSPMLASHILELRSALNAARAALGAGTGNYTDPGLASGSTVKTGHINQLRAAVK